MHVAIIGAYGSAGVAVADRLIDEDVHLSLIDDGDPPAGLCILRGCMPSKDVLSAAGHRFRARHDDRLQGTPTIDAERVIARKDDHVDTFTAHRQSALRRMGERETVDLYHASAEFVDERTLRVGDRVLEPDYIVIATGSVPSVPDLEGIDAVEYATSADVLDAADLPDSGIVMGFGYVGLELVPYLSELGVDLTVIEHDDRPLDEADPPFGDTILDLYRTEFDVDILTRTDERAVEPTQDGGVRLTVDRRTDGASSSETVEADQLYLFTGRRPNLDGLGVNRTALEPGAGWVGSTMQARDDERIFVVGDANGREPILHVAKEQGHVAAENICRHANGDRLRQYDTVHHHIVFSGLAVYPFARVGHSAASAERANFDYHCVSRQASDDGVFLVKNAPAGLARLVVGTDGTVLGYQGLHLHADVMAKTMQVAIELDLDVRALPDRAYHPTTPELLDGLIRDATAALER